MAKKQQEKAPPVVVEYYYGKEEAPTIPSGITWDFLERECVGVKEATKEMDFANSQYTRTLLWQGKIEGVKVMKGRIPTCYITLSSISLYRERHLRSAKLRRYDFRIFPEAEEQVRTALDKLGIVYSLDVAYSAPTIQEAEVSILEEGGDTK